MHRKTREIPAGQIIGGLILLALAVAALVGVSALGSPSAASVRPYWDGRSPAVWTSPVDPMCLARYNGRHGVIMINVGDGTHRYPAMCMQEGGEVYSWGLVIAPKP